MAIIHFLDHQGKIIEGSVGKDNNKITIGRSKKADLMVKNPTVSRLHCQVLFASGTFYLEDLGSSNGTYYNMEKLNPNQPVPLEDGDVFFAGNLEVKFYFEDDDYMEIEDEALPPAAPSVENDFVMDADKNPDKENFEEVKDADKEVPEDIVIMDNDNEIAPVAEESIEEIPKDQLKEPEASVESVESIEESVDSPVEFGEVKHTVMQKLETVNEDTKRLIESLQDQIKEKDDIISGLQRQVDELREAVGRLPQVEEASGISIEEMQSMLDSTEAENTRMEDQIEQLKARIAEDNEKLKHLTELENQVLQAQQDEQEKEELKNRLTMLQQQLEDAEKKINEQKELTEKAIKSEDFERIVKERDALLEENKRWEKLKKQFEQDLSDLKTQRDALQEQIELTKADAETTDELAANLKEAQSRIEELTKDLETARLANRSYIKKVSHMLEENNKLKAATSQKDNSVLDALKKENKELQNRIADLESQMDRTVKAPVDSPKDYQKLRESYEDLNELIHQLQTDVDILTQLSNDNTLNTEEKASRLGTQAGQVSNTVTDFKTGLKTLDSLLIKIEV